MRIGIVQSGYEMLPLFNFLSSYDHEYHIFCDWAYGPWGDKSPALKQARIQEGVQYLQDKVDVLIVPPLYEIHLLSMSTSVPLLPLYNRYLMDYAFMYSLVGKIGLLCDAADMSSAQDLISSVATEYTLTPQQQATRLFQQPFAFWKKEVRMWKYFLTTYGKREWMVRKTLKYDMRYFHDAAVDTIIPTDRGMLFRQKIVRQRINRKKMRFHGLDAVEHCFTTLSTEQGFSSSAYSVTLHCTDTPQQLLDERKWMDVLGRGENIASLISV